MLETETNRHSLKVDSSRWLVREIKIPIEGEDPNDFDTEETIRDFERFKGLFPSNMLPSNLEAWNESHLELALKDYQKFLELEFEYLGHKFKPVYSEEANDNCDPFPFTEKDNPDFCPYQIEGWNHSDFQMVANEAGCDEIYIYLMDNQVYIANGLDYPFQIDCD